MKIKLLIITISIVCCFGCNSSQLETKEQIKDTSLILKSKPQEDSIMSLPKSKPIVDVNRTSKIIDSLYFILENKKGRNIVEVEKQYFESFPDSFELFVNVFGYKKDSINNEISYSPLYKNSHLYINKFYNLDTDKKLFYEKVINIAKNASWDADGVNHFQRGIRQIISKDILEFCSMLMEFNEEEIAGFWLFYFDGYNPPLKISEQLESLKNMDSTLYYIMIKSHDQLQNH